MIWGLFVFCVPEGAEKVERAVFTGLGAFVSAALLNAHELVANLNLIIDNFSEECFPRYDTVEAFGVFHYFYNEKKCVAFMAYYFATKKLSLHLCCIIFIIICSGRRKS